MKNKETPNNANKQCEEFIEIADIKYDNYYLNEDNEQVKEMLRIAEEYEVGENFFFITTFKRYQVQLNILNQLEQKIMDDGTLVTKEYVKGRANVYTHPAVDLYNKTSTSANQTVATLIKIIKSLRDDENEEEIDDELLSSLGLSNE